MNLFFLLDGRVRMDLGVGLVTKWFHLVKYDSSAKARGSRNLLTILLVNLRQFRNKVVMLGEGIYP
jgi:hypothetical protein